MRANWLSGSHQYSTKVAPSYRGFLMMAFVTNVWASDSFCDVKTLLMSPGVMLYAAIVLAILYHVSRYVCAPFLVSATVCF